MLSQKCRLRVKPSISSPGILLICLLSCNTLLLVHQFVPLGLKFSAEFLGKYSSRYNTLPLIHSLPLSAVGMADGNLFRCTTARRRAVSPKEDS